MKTWKRGTGGCLWATTLGLAVAVTAAGCGSDSTVGGLTNPNPGSVVDRDKGAVRDDLPVPDMNGQKEPAAEAASSSPASTGTAAGTGGPGGGQPGSAADPRGDSPEAATPVPATPPADSNTGSAAGATRPSGPIKVGTPTSPQ